MAGSHGELYDYCDDGRSQYIYILRDAIIYSSTKNMPTA